MKLKSREERKTRLGRPTISEQTKALVIKLYNEDYLCRDIAAACNISESSVFRILRAERSRKTQE